MIRDTLVHYLGLGFFSEGAAKRTIVLSPPLLTLSIFMTGYRSFCILSQPALVALTPSPSPAERWEPI